MLQKAVPIISSYSVTSFYFSIHVYVKVHRIVTIKVKH